MKQTLIGILHHFTSENEQLRTADFRRVGGPCGTQPETSPVASRPPVRGKCAGNMWQTLQWRGHCRKYYKWRRNWRENQWRDLYSNLTSKHQKSQNAFNALSVILSLGNFPKEIIYSKDMHKEFWEQRNPNWENVWIHFRRKLTDRPRNVNLTYFYWAT